MMIFMVEKMMYIVIPVFNRKVFTRDCLNSLREQTDRRFKVIIVDDGSTDGTSQMLKDEFPEVTVLNGDGNLFWTASVNMGIKLALDEGADYIMTMNNDVIATKEYIHNMYKWIEKKPDAVMGSLEIDAVTKKINFAGERISWATGSYISLLNIVPESEHHGLHAVTHLPGRGLLIPRKVFEKIGLFDQKVFPHYMADFDFTHKLLRHGFEMYCNYDAKLYTYPQESGDSMNRQKKSLKNYYNHLFSIKGGGNLRNFTWYAWKNCPKRYLPSYLLIGYARRMGGYLIK
jgi:GT2 family glycosyltransferase